MDAKAFIISSRKRGLKPQIKLQDGGQLAFEISDPSQLDSFNTFFTEKNTGVRERKLRNKRAAKEQLDQVVNEGGSIKVYNDKTFEVLDSSGNTVDFGKKVGASVGEAVGYPLNVKNRTRESDVIKDMFDAFSSNKDIFKKDEKITASKTGEGMATSDEVMDKTKTVVDKPAGQTDAKDLKSWRSEYEAAEGKTWDTALKGKAGDRRAYSFGFANFLKDKAVTDTGFNYDDIAKLHPSNYLDTDSYNDYNAIVDSYHALGLPFKRRTAIPKKPSTVTETSITDTTTTQGATTGTEPAIEETAEETKETPKVVGEVTEKKEPVVDPLEGFNLMTGDLSAVDLTGITPEQIYSNLEVTGVIDKPTIDLKGLYDKKQNLSTDPNFRGLPIEERRNIIKDLNAQIRVGEEESRTRVPSKVSQRISEVLREQKRQKSTAAVRRRTEATRARTAKSTDASKQQRLKTLRYRESLGILAPKDQAELNRLEAEFKKAAGGVIKAQSGELLDRSTGTPLSRLLFDRRTATKPYTVGLDPQVKVGINPYTFGSLSAPPNPYGRFFTMRGQATPDVLTQTGVLGTSPAPKTGTLGVNVDLDADISGYDPNIPLNVQQTTAGGRKGFFGRLGDRLKEGSYKARQGAGSSESGKAKKDLDLLRASLSSAANRLLLSRDVNQVNPYAVDPTLPVLPVRGLPQSVRANYQQQLAAQKRDATRARSSDPALNLIARQVAAQQERSALDELAARESDLILRDKQRVTQEAARNKQLQTTFRVQADQFKNELNKLSALGKLERDRATISPFLGYLEGRSQQQKTGQAVLAGARARNIEAQGASEVADLKSKFVSDVTARATALGITDAEFLGSPEGMKLKEKLRTDEAKVNAQTSSNIETFIGDLYR